MLYNINLSSLLLGCLMKQPSLLTLPQFPLSKQDFEPELFHKIIYVAINKLVHNGIQEARVCHKEYVISCLLHPIKNLPVRNIAPDKEIHGKHERK